MPYFDDFDLSTVDILLISQYVTAFPYRAIVFLWLAQQSLKWPACGSYTKALLGVSNLGQGVAGCANIPAMSAIVFVAQSMQYSSTLHPLHLPAILLSAASIFSFPSYTSFISSSRPY
jgi:hypothetical protein